MPAMIQRRRFIALVPSLVVLPSTLAGKEASSLQETDTQRGIHPEFPAQDPKRVREMVGASHGNVARVTELLKESPALAKATWDWGFGDWETALGAASHVGSLEIAKLLMEHGARPDIFTFAMLGQLDVVRAYVNANPGIQKTHGPHGITLMAHARKGGEAALPVVRYLEELGNADNQQTSTPLTEEESRIFLGNYIGTDDASLRLQISLNKDGRLNISRLPDGANRMLFYLGNNEFYPTGAMAVRIQFGVTDGRAISVSVVDGNQVLRALRAA